jgi:putative transposase
VSRAGYYRHWAASLPRQEETAIRDAVQRVALANRRYGHRRVTRELSRSGIVVNHKRVLRLMREDNPLCLRKRAFVPMTTDSRHEWSVVPNLARGMVLTGLDQLWVADITYVRLLEEFAFLAVLLDAFSRKVIGWALEKHLQVTLALAALEMAIKARRPPSGSLIHHSDRGVQYACRDYTAVLAASTIGNDCTRRCRIDRPSSSRPTRRGLRIIPRVIHNRAELRCCGVIAASFSRVRASDRLHSAHGDGCYRPLSPTVSN